MYPVGVSFREVSIVCRYRIKAIDHYMYASGFVVPRLALSL